MSHAYETTERTDRAGVFFEENKPKDDHGRRSLRAGALATVARGVNAVVQIGSVILLARLLSPEDYGLVSMVAAIVGFASVVVDLGTRDATIQRARVTRGEMSALFWITIAVGVGFAVFVIASGPLIARLYSEPRLTAIALASSLSIVMSALTCQHYALLRRAMMFRELAVVEVGASLIGAGSAIAMAFSGFGYWALVARPIVASSVTVLGVWLHCRWLPGKPTITSGVKEMLKFGIHLLGFSIADFCGTNADRVAIGIRSGASGLGYYQKAFLVYSNALEMTTAIHGVCATSLSKLRNDPLELKRLWSKALSTLVFYAMPAFGVLAVISQDLIVMLLGEKWSLAGVLLSVLALRGIPHVVERTLGWLHVSAGRADRQMRWGVVATCVQLVALFLGLPFGPIGVAWAYVLSMYALFIPTIAYAGRPLGIGATDVVKVVGRPLIATLGAAGLGFVLRVTVLADTPGMVRTALLASGYIAFYLLLMVGVFKVTSPLKVALSFLPTQFASFERSGRSRGQCAK